VCDDNLSSNVVPTRLSTLISSISSHLFLKMKSLLQDIDKNFKNLMILKVEKL